MEGFEKLEQKYGEVCQQLDIFEKIKEELRKEILLSFETTYGHQGAKYTNPVTNNSLQRIIQVRETVDGEELHKHITNDQWGKIKKEVVDMDKFTAAIKMGLINPAEINGCVKTTEIDKVAWKRGK